MVKNIVIPEGSPAYLFRSQVMKNNSLENANHSIEATNDDEAKEKCGKLKKKYEKVGSLVNPMLFKIEIIG